MLGKSLSISFVGLLLLTFRVLAGTSALEGIVKDPTGRPIKGADVRIEARKGSNFSKIVKTDATGHYTSNDLAVGIYKVTVVVNGVVKASILNAYTQSGKSTQLNFELTQKMVSAKKHTHSVWIPPQTGTRIGGGWVEVDDNGKTGLNNVETVSGSLLQNLQSRALGSAKPGGGP